MHETTDETHLHDTQPVYNGKRQLSVAAILLAHRNSRNMTRQGYAWEFWDAFDGEAGQVFTRGGASYSIWLPGTLTSYPEGKCSCPYFEQEHVCKHLYFAVSQAGKVPSPAASWEAWDKWEGVRDSEPDGWEDSPQDVHAALVEAMQVPVSLPRPLPKPMI